MKLVVDANIVFSAMLKDGESRRLLLDDRLTLCAPLFLKEEILKYKPYLAKKAGMAEKELSRFADELIALSGIEFVDLFGLGSYVGIAGRISPDPKDVPYLALALFEGCELWSNDTALYEKQSVIKIITTTKLRNILR